MATVIETPISAVEAVAAEVPSVAPSEPEVEMVTETVQEALFLKDCVRVTIGAGKAEFHKFVSYDDFRRILTKVVGVRENQSKDGFALPSNCFYFAKSLDELNVSSYFPECIKTVSHYYDGGTKKFSIIVPNMIISHTLRKAGASADDNTWEMYHSKYFSTALPVSRLPQDFIQNTNSDSGILHSPFPNTFDGHSMCFGNNNMPSKFSRGNLRSLDWYYQFLFESPFNNDLSVRGNKETSSPRAWFGILSAAAVAKDPKFPYSIMTGYKDLPQGR